MRARVPASSANLGPGFDALAIALNRYIVVDIEPAGALRVSSTGEGAGLFNDASHLAVQVAKQVLGHDRIAVSVHSQIPVSRGLGSSAALAAAAAAAAGAEDPFAIAAAIDGHPENAAASIYGGLIAATDVHGQAQAVHLPLSGALAYVVIVPDRSLSTAEARQVLPSELSRADATFNLGRMGLLLAGLADPALLSAAATEDRIHQSARAALFPEAPGLLDALVSAGALASCWSGAGPSLLGIVANSHADAVRRGAEDALRAAEVPGRVFLLQADLVGLVYGDEAELPAS